MTSLPRPLPTVPTSTLLLLPLPGLLHFFYSFIPVSSTSFWNFKEQFAKKRRRGKFVFLVHDLPLLDHSQAPSFSLCVIYDEKEYTTMKENFLSSSKLLPVFPAKILSSLSTNKWLILVNVKTFFLILTVARGQRLCLLLQRF